MKRFKCIFAFYFLTIHAEVEYDKSPAKNRSDFEEVRKTIVLSEIYMTDNVFARAVWDYDIDSNGLKLNERRGMGLPVYISFDLLRIIAQKAQARDRSNYSFNPEEMIGQVKVFGHKGQELAGYAKKVHLELKPRPSSYFFSADKPDYRLPYIFIQIPLKLTMNLKNTTLDQGQFNTFQTETWMENLIQCGKPDGEITISKQFKADIGQKGYKGSYILKLVVSSEEAAKLFDGLNDKVKVHGTISVLDRKEGNDGPMHYTICDEGEVMMNLHGDEYGLDLYFNPKDLDKPYTFNKVI